MGCCSGAREGCLVPYAKVLSGIMSIVCGVRDVVDVFSTWSGIFNIKMITLALTMVGFGFLSVVSGATRSAHVKSHFGFLDTHLHLTWFHDLNGFMCYNPDWLGILAAVMHWLTAIMCIVHHCMTGTQSEARPLLG